MSIQAKRQEIIEFAKERIEEIYDYDKDKVSVDNTQDLHHEIFNTDYYIIGHYQAKEWLGSDAFDVIYEIQEFERDNFGCVTTDLSSAESVVNMYVYIVGYEILEDVITDILDEKDDWGSDEEEVS